MNPVIYSIFNTEFREAFRKILTSYVRNECCNNQRNGNFNYGQSERNQINHRNLAAMKHNSLEFGGSVSPGININNDVKLTGSRNGSTSGGGQGVPTVKTAGGKGSGSRTSSSKKGQTKDESKVRRPLLPFYKRGKSMVKENTGEHSEQTVKPSNATISNSVNRSCSLDTFPLTNPTCGSKKSSSPLLTYSHVDIHTDNHDHGGKISAI